ncbi:MAG: patatin-like phospholipase family protein [Deltaproteobacteria bacterium]|nr:patatin-like phospholipase family protein [Deltaproteobacteria bacterium]
MKSRRRSKEEPSIKRPLSLTSDRPVGLVLSGGGSRAAYQVGALKALSHFIKEEQFPISYTVGSSIGAINTLIFGATVKNGLSYAIEELESLWLERTFRNSFKGSPSITFLRSVKIALLKYALNPGPHASDEAIFNPEPLMNRISTTIDKHGGLRASDRDPNLKGMAVITTIEGTERKPLLFFSGDYSITPDMMSGASFQIHKVDQLTAQHGFASAALPTVLPPVQLDIDGGDVRFVDGGISQNIPVDPCVRMGAERIIVIDISGRYWWLNRYGEPEDTRPDWEVPAAADTFCMRPPEIFKLRNQEPLGPLLKDAVGKTTKDFISSLGATWPVFTFIRKKLGEELAYEVMSYVALHPEYSRALIERGYDETMAVLRNKHHIEFKSAKKVLKEEEEEIHQSS